MFYERGLSEHGGLGMEPGLRRGHCPAVPVRSPGGASSGPWPGELRAAGVAWPGWSRIRLLYFLCNSSSGLPPGSVARKSMCSDSIISQVALLQVHCTRKGDISGHVCVDQTGVCVCTHTCVHTYMYTHTQTHISSPPFPPSLPHLHLQAQDSLEFHNLCRLL